MTKKYNKLINECDNYFYTIQKFDDILWNESKSKQDKIEALKSIFEYSDNLISELYKMPQTKKCKDNICKILDMMSHYENSSTFGEDWKIIVNEYEKKEQMENEEMIKNKYVHFRANDSEIAFIKDKAEENGVTMTDYIKIACGLPSYKEFNKAEQEELDRYIDEQKNDDSIYCKTYDEIMREEQEILNEYERLHKSDNVCESYDEMKQREQEELDKYIDEQENNDFEFLVNQLENDFKERLESGRLTFFELRLLEDSLDRCREFYESKLDECIFDEMKLAEIY